MTLAIAISIALLGGCSDDGGEQGEGDFVASTTTPEETVTAYFDAIRANDKPAALDLACGVQHQRLAEVTKVRTIVVEDSDVADTAVDEDGAAATVTLSMIDDYPADELRLELEKDEGWKVCDLTIVM